MQVNSFGTGIVLIIAIPCNIATSSNTIFEEFHCIGEVLTRYRYTKSRGWNGIDYNRSGRGSVRSILGDAGSIAIPINEQVTENS